MYIWIAAAAKNWLANDASDHVTPRTTLKGPWGERSQVLMRLCVTQDGNWVSVVLPLGPKNTDVEDIAETCRSGTDPDEARRDEQTAGIGQMLPASHRLRQAVRIKPR